MSTDNLGNKAKKGFIWSAVESFSSQGFQFVFSILLARLLTPSDFGVIGMLTIFLALSESIVDSGFGNALMQKKDRNQLDYSTVFYINLFISVCLYVIMFFAAPFIANFYNMPILVDITRVMSIRFIISGFILVQVTKLTVDLNFKKLTKIRVTSTVLSGTIGVILAYNGFGVWSLVAQSVAAYFFLFVLLWTFSRWLPSLCFSMESFRALFRYGSKLLVTGLYGQLFEHINSLIIGKFYSTNLLGFYTKARSLAQLPSMNITTILYRVSFPVLCSIQDDDERLANAINKLIKQTYFIVFPLMFGLFAVSSPLVDFLLTSKWSGCVPYLRLLCISMSLLPICAYNIDLLLVKGHSGTHLKLDIIKKCFTVLVLSITASISVMAICIGSIFTGLFSWLLTGYYGSKSVKVTIKDQIKDMLPSFVISVVMVVAIFPFSYMGINSLIILLLQILIGATIYFLLSFYFNKESLLEMRSLIKRD